jgi:hypothetical protein
MPTLGEFFQEIFDDANESVKRIQREGHFLRDLADRASFGLRVAREVAQQEIAISAEHVRDKVAEMLKRGR